MEEEDEILTQLNGQPKTTVVEQEKTDPEDPILQKLNGKLKKKDVTASGLPSGNDSPEPVTPSKPSSKKPTSTPKTKDVSFIAAIKDMLSGYDKPADEKDVTPSPFLNAVQRGVNLGKQAALVGPFADKPEKDLKRVAELQKDTAQLPSSDVYKKFTQAKTFQEAGSEFVKSPVKILAELTGESISAMAVYGAPRIAAGAGLGALTGSVFPGVGTMSGAGGGAIVGMADTSFGLEFTGALLESLQQAGVDTKNADQLRAAFENDEVISAARSHALKKGIPIALFDLISGGLAGKLVSKPAKSLVGKFGQAGLELATQSILGAAGETSGQLISGEQIQPGAIVAEALGELGTTPVEAGIGATTFNKVQESIDKQDGTTNTQPVDDTAKVEGTDQGIGQSAETEGTTGEGETVLPATDEQTIDSSSSEGVVGESGQEVELTEKEKQLAQNYKSFSPADHAKAAIQYEEKIANNPDSDKMRIWKDLLQLHKKLSNEEVQKTASETPISDGRGRINTDESIQQKEEQSSEQSTAEQRQESEDTSTEITDVSQQNITTEQLDEQQNSAVEPVVQEPSKGADTPPPTSDEEAISYDGNRKKNTYAIAQRIYNSDASESIKRGVREKGASYIPKGLNITDKEATDLIELYGDDKAESLVRDTKNDLTGDTRTALAARLYEKYKRQADESSDASTKSRYYDRAVDIALTSAEQLKEAGRQTNAAKIWKAITADEDMTVLALEKENQRQKKYFLQPIYEQVKRSRQQFDAEIRKAITEGVEANLKRAKLITADKKKQIADAFDALKIKTPKGTLQATTLLPEVWNGGVEAVKRAVLAGADLANAIQAGIDYIRQNHQGDWDENEFRNAITPAVEQMIPKEKVESDKIDESKITTPKLQGRKKKQFIEEAVSAYNEGKLTDEKFEDLYAKQLGAREFSSEDRGKIRELAKTISEVEKFEEQVKNDFTAENIAKYKELLAKASKANTELQAYAQKPNNIWDTLISIMQGNLLTPLSLVTNIYSNTALQPLRFTSTGIGSLIDYGVSQLAKTGLLNESYKDRTIDLAELQKGYFKGNWEGFKEGLKQLKDGPKSNERSLREIDNQFSPVRAISRWGEANRSAEQKINDAIEGTFGLPAEAMFRLLNLGDKPFRRAAELARAMEIAKQKGLTGKDMDKFIMFPDDESAELIQKAGNDATFQQEHQVSKGVQKILTWIMNGIGSIPIIGGPLKVIAKSQLPYVKTPLNITIETLKYAAFPITGAVGIHQITKGNRRTGSVLVGQAIVGAMVFAVAKELFSKGLLSWDEPYDKEAGKQRERRQIQYDNIPPNAINISAIQRGVIGDGWEIKDDDTWIDYSKLGVMGNLFNNYANNYFSNIREKGQMPEQSDFYVDMFTTAPRVLSQSLDQSFLKGTNTLLTALQDGGGYETEQWLINTSQALSAIAYPNTLSTISKASDEFARDLRDEDFAERLKNTYKTKFFIGEQLPAKVNLWGEKITGQPEGRNKYAFYLWDPTKFKNVDTENFKYKLYESWKTDKFNDDWLPSIPKRNISYRGVKIPLNGHEYEKYATYVGQERARLVSTYVNSAGFDRKDKEKVLEKLKELYDDGRERGKKKFLQDTGWNILTPKRLSEIAEK